ncbi:SRPBCC family protein [Herbidospora sp. NEAU-GS84]|uniref:SRPBCC family protein n=1 Tax=Herbidospora solisilvae TaxID=2696284 RepID=A0A7C9NEE6_9ACTN|nr:SRPBCC family protein [Herbidospora solisilvae]NAS20172.1 SRPBCC family protein [Herbidospora solisilvae]
MAVVRLRVAAEAGVPAERLFAVMTDWPRHREWMVLTDARVTSGDGRGVGSRLSAFTGVGRVGFTDTMEITAYTPGAIVEVRHTGALVRGGGVFRVSPLPDGRSRVEWVEELELPFGVVGRVGWVVARPVAAVALKVSLERLTRLAARG